MVELRKEDPLTLCEGDKVKVQTAKAHDPCQFKATLWATTSKTPSSRPETVSTPCGCTILFLEFALLPCLVSTWTWLHWKALSS